MASTSEDTGGGGELAGTRWAAARLEEIPARGGLQLTIDGRAVALFIVDGEPVAYDGRCRHRAGPIGDGYVRDGVVTCPLHWWRYDLRTGALVGDPSVRLERFPAELDAGVVHVTLPPTVAAEAPVSIRERLLALARAGRADGNATEDGGPGSPGTAQAGQEEA